MAAPTLAGRVLLAQGGVDHQGLLPSWLRQAGLEVDVADNGRAAVESALATDYDLVLMDAQMPQMDGLAATRLLQAAGCTTPVVALATGVSKEDTLRCKSAGCVDVLAQPVSRQRLLDMVAQRMRKPRPAPTADELMERALQALYAEFRLGLAARLADIEHALEACDIGLLAQLAHSLKGTAGSYGQPAITEICARMEPALRTRDIAALRQDCARLHEAVMSALREHA